MLIKVKSERLKVKGFIAFALCSLFFVQAKAQELLPYPLDTIDGEEVYRYEVEKSIGLYRIGINFNVSQSDIVRLNPQLRERGLHYEETIYIPTGRPVIIQSEPKVVSETLTVTTIYLEDSAKVEVNPKETADTVIQQYRDTVILEYRDSVIPTQDTIVPDTIVDTRRMIELALMLPFESKQVKRSSNAERMMELYQGALLALHDLQNDSVLFRLRVYDTERSEIRVQALCDSTELDSVRGVLGLIYPIQIARMVNWCDSHKVPLILPFSDDVNLSAHPYAMQFNSTDTQEADSLCQWMLAQDSTAHIVTIDVREADVASFVRTLRKQMTAQGIHYTTLPMRDLMVDSCAYALDPDKENIFILHSDRYQNIRMLLPHLSKLSARGYRIRLVSQYSWQKEQIDLPQVYTSMFKSNIDLTAYDALWTQFFVGQHVSDTPRYDLLGYDLMRALVGAVIGDELQVTGLQSDIHWVQMNNGGYQNAQVRIVEK